MSTEHLLNDVGNILIALLGTEDEPRVAANKHLSGLTLQDPAGVLLLLGQIGGLNVGGFPMDYRLLALILLRRFSFTPLPGLFLNESHHHATEPFEYIAERVKARIETALSTGLKDERDPKMRRGLATCAALWAKDSSARQRPCVTFPPTVLELIQSSEPELRINAYTILDITPTLLIDSMGDPLSAAQLSELLRAGFSDRAPSIRIEAVKAMRSIVTEALTGKEREDVGPGLIHAIFEMIRTVSPINLGVMLQPLAELASIHPTIFVPSFDTLIPFLLTVTTPPSTPSIDYAFSPYPSWDIEPYGYDEIANPATEILLTLAELRRTQVLQWQDGRMTNELVGHLIGRHIAALEYQSEECADWLEETELEEEDDSYPMYVEESLDRLASSLGGPAMLPVLSQHASLMQQPDWRCRYSMLMAIGSTAGGCADDLIPRITDVLELISPTAKDPHPRVRYGFLQCLGQLCQDLYDCLQTQYPQQILNIIITLLQDAVPRVRAHAGACLVNFFDSNEIASLSTMVEPLVRALFAAFHSGPLYMQEQAFASMSSVAAYVGEEYLPFYRETMDMVFSVLASPLDASHRKLVGRALECATMTGLGVGKATFSGDAVRLAQIMINVQNDITAAEDPRTPYLVEAWTCLSRTLGSDFKPFLPHVIPPLLKAAAYKPPAEPERKMDSINDDRDMASETTIASVAKVQSGEMSEKILAFDNLAVYAYSLTEHFEPYLAECMELSLESLTFTQSEDVREAAAFLVPALLSVAKKSNAWGDNPGALQQIFQTMINAMAREPETNGFLALLFKSFTDSLRIIAVALPSQLSDHLFRTCYGHLDNARNVRQDRMIQEEYMDEQDHELYVEEQEEEDAALDHMSKALDMLIQYDKSPETQNVVEHLWRNIAEVKALRLSGSEPI